MCGIAGILYAQPGDALPRRASVRRMTETLAHRGPDASGIHADDPLYLGHRRLSIIDLSDAGCQPMGEPEGRYTLVYNGEVYNYRELRQELEGNGHRFRTGTDSEVVLRAYREWGVAALARFNGMWALAIWDAERRELFAARDRAGKKPFYYAITDDGSFHFASEVRALRAEGLRFGLNPQAAFDFLTQGTYGHLGAAGFFDGLSQLPPAHYLTARAGEAPRIHRYWDIPVVRQADRVPYDAAFRRRFRDLLQDAVKLRLRADVPVGMTLSGGLDSSAIALCVERETGGAPMHLFTSVYPGSGYDETVYFDAVVEKLSRPVVHRVLPAEGGWRERLLAVLEAQEEPFGDTSIFAHYHLMETARANGVPVVLSGQGGDELLLGYPSMVQAYLGHLIGSGRWSRARREITAWADAGGGSPARVLRGSLLHALPLGPRDRVRARGVAALASRVTNALRRRASLRRFGAEPGRGSFDSYLAQVFKRFAIPHLTHYDDRNAMTFSVEGRMPFLDYRLVEMMFSVRYEALYHDGLTKRVLRDAFAGEMPEIVRTRRDKIGFYTPLARWLRAQRDWVRDVMRPEHVREMGVLDADRYGTRLAAFEAGDDSAELEIWRGFVFHLWAERFGVAPLGGSPGPITVVATQPSPARARSATAVVAGSA
ncbi:MAG: asparagine synthase (glutamine-hydrolyzing) [Gemmatimonadaceae bacterium]